MNRRRFSVGLNVLAALVTLLGAGFSIRYVPRLLSGDFGALLSIALIGVMLAWVTAVIVLLWQRDWIRHRRRELLSSLVVMILCLVAAEVGFHVFDPQRPLYVRHPYLNYVLTPGYESVDGHNRHDALGYRGDGFAIPKPDGLFRIALLGGSTVYSVGVRDYRRDWASELELALAVRSGSDLIEVINAGVPGYNSWESLINLQFRVLDIDPDLIVIYHGANDIHTRLVLPSAYRSDNTGRRKQWERFHPFSPLRLRIVRKLLQLDRMLFDVDADTFCPTEDPGPSAELGMTPLEALQHNPPVFFERNLRSMAAIAREHDVAVLLSTWAHSPVFSDYAASEHYEYGFAEVNGVVARVAADTGEPVYDFAAEMSTEKRYWSDGRHVNEEGAELKAQLFARYLLDAGLVPVGN